MAHRVEESPTRADDKLPVQVVDTHNDDLAEQPGAGTSTAVEDYSIERVEAVYRKLDLRIIPGWIFI